MQTFKKEERLSGKKKIEVLFSSGKSFYIKPFKVVWLFKNEPHKYPARLLITVPKRHFKKAVERNLIKRRIREAYRKNKELIYSFMDNENVHLNMALVYAHSDLLSYQEIEKKIILVLQRLKSEYDKDFR